MGILGEVHVIHLTNSTKGCAIYDARCCRFCSKCSRQNPGHQGAFILRANNTDLLSKKLASWVLNCSDLHLRFRHLLASHTLGNAPIWNCLLQKSKYSYILIPSFSSFLTFSNFFLSLNLRDMGCRYFNLCVSICLASFSFLLSLYPSFDHMDCSLTVLLIPFPFHFCCLTHPNSHFYVTDTVCVIYY